MGKTMQLVFAVVFAIYFGCIDPKLHDTDFFVIRPCLTMAENLS